MCLRLIFVPNLAKCSEENVIFVKTKAHVRLFYLLSLRLWPGICMPRDQTQP